MSGKDWTHVKTLFGQASLLPPAERDAFLSRACGGDAELRKEVESLLDAHRRAGDFLDEPIAFEPGEVVSAGERIGPYRIQSRVARGGMGVVYRAVRDDDVFERRVAIKIGGRAPELLDRFRQERQILGQLHHPHIAGILDGGALPTGHLYLVMEYVEGTSLDVYCAERKLSVEERLRLFLEVCDAVSYAHQNLVVHRDIKPANIVVTPGGVPKLLDFGIAKLLTASSEGAAAPATILPALTPAYASPEQVKGAPITTSSDVYSLGVLLYELLSGVPPYAVRADSLEDIVETVCERVPDPPSVALARSPAESRRERGLAPSLHRDLDSITMRALRKEPEHRYLSVERLAKDVERHLEGAPVEARGNDLGYRAGRFLARHKVPAFGLALLFASLVAGMTATYRQARIAEANRAKAERRFEQVRSLAGSFLFDFHDAIEALPGATPARELVVAKAVEYLESLAEDAEDDPTLARELALGYLKVGDVQGGLYQTNLGRSDEGLASYRRAVELLEALAGRADSSSEDRLLLAEAYRKLGDGLRVRGERDEALDSYRRSRETAESVSRDDPAYPASLSELAQNALAIASLEFDARRGDRGLEALERTLAYYRALRDEPGSETDALWGLCRVHYRVASVLYRRGELSRGRAEAERGLAVCDFLHESHPLDVRYRRGVVSTKIQLGVIQWKQGELQDALATMEQALGVVDPLLEMEPSNEQLRRDKIIAEVDYGDILADAGRFSEAEAALSRALETGAELLAQDPGNVRTRHLLAQTGATASDVLVRAGELERASDRLREALALERELPPESRSGDALHLLAAANARLGLALLHTTRDEGGRRAACGRLRESDAISATPGKTLFPNDAELEEELRRALDACEAVSRVSDFESVALVRLP